MNSPVSAPLPFSYTEITRDLQGDLWIRRVDSNSSSLAVFTSGPCYICLPGNPACPISVYPARSAGQ